ncbi:CaiB/BaiF CoA transferase family protein [Thermaurantiacus tibetensis]|uniref:CaiB/BaiF CoA transferase family protein n=1 Tax=Thermaurantiacus tibetensis TaxID=2759035 RepID=UPI00188E7AE2|nr:CaiB/BaiF CoA-transferase family protein [Thermaurantiacus tibetensis]
MPSVAPPSPAPAAPPGPLAGVRVLDLSRVLAGPWATQALADLGATVWKVERPGAGDDTRGWGPPFLPDASGDACYFAAANRNKKALAIDFGKPEGAALIRALAGHADLLVENFRTGTLARHGLDPAELRKANPRLVTCSITGFGQTGPRAKEAGYDFLIQGMGGLMSLTGEPGGGPLRAGIPVADLATGLYATISMLAALHHARATGQGQHIDAGLLQAQVAMLANHWANWLNAGRVPQRSGNAHATVVPYRDFPAADGTLIIAVGSDRQFAALARVLGRPDLAGDPRYATNAGRQTHRALLEAEIAAETAKRPREALLAALTEAGVPAGPINSLPEVFADPQVEATGLVATVARADGTPIHVVGYPQRLSATPASVRSAPPRLGEHTRAILAEVLGLAEPELARLEASGVIAAAR